MEPLKALAHTDNEQICPAAQEARERLERVVANPVEAGEAGSTPGKL